ncbi:MAG: glycoside hydrolase family 2 TIM barrel-domain containing protein, partial [Halanaerobiales bacterium]
MNTKRLFNDGWAFAKSSLEVKDIDNLQFEQVDIPHDWLIYNTLDLYENSIGWYRKNHTYNGEADQVLLYFDGVYMDSSLYVNGQFVGEWKYGYSSFEHDITESLHKGENEILLKVVHQSPNSRWYSGAGIYRNVWLKIRNKNHIITDGIYVTTEQQEEIWYVDIETELNIHKDVKLTHTIIHENQEITHRSELMSADISNPMKISKQKLTVDRPLLWSPDNPNLYKLVTKLELLQMDDKIQDTMETGKYIGTKEKSRTIETITQNIGFRKIELDPDEGFILNGNRLKLNGVCEHHDLGALGAAFNKTALERRFAILKEMGVNAVRTAHNMPAVEFMELADEMGLLVVSEAFDMWERSKTEYDYARFFKEWAQKDVKSWVWRDRNHPSLMMWSIGNEIYDTHAGERGQELTRMLMEWVLEHDPEENGRVTIGSNYMPWENAQKCADIVKIAGYNYGEKYYQNHHLVHPDWVIYGSETGSVVQSRGIYHFPAEQSILADDDEQCSALGNSATSWGADSTEAC